MLTTRVSEGWQNGCFDFVILQHDCVGSTCFLLAKLNYYEVTSKNVMLKLHEK